MLAVRDQKSQHHVRDNLADMGSPTFPSKSMKMYENLVNNQKLANPVPLGQTLPKVYPGINSVHISMYVYKAANFCEHVNVLP